MEYISNQHKFPTLSLPQHTFWAPKVSFYMLKWCLVVWLTFPVWLFHFLFSEWSGQEIAKRAKVEQKGRVKFLYWEIYVKNNSILFMCFILLQNFHLCKFCVYVGNKSFKSLKSQSQIAAWNKSSVLVTYCSIGSIWWKMLTCSWAYWNFKAYWLNFKGYKNLFQK